MPILNRSQYLQRIQYIKLAAFIGVLIGGLIILLAVENMLLSFVLAFVLSYLLSPLVNAVERTGVERIHSIIITYIFVSFLLAIGISAATPFISAQTNALKLELPRYIEGTATMFQDFESRFEAMTGTRYSVDLGAKVEGYLFSWTSSIFEDLPAIVSKSLTTIILAPFFAFFLLKDGRTFSRGLLALVPNNLFELSLNLYHQINDQMGQFVRARLLEAGIVGLVVWLGLAVTGFPYATLLALFAALTNLIPYIGPIIGAVPAVLIALISQDAFTLLAVTIVYSVAQIIDMVFIIPLVVAKIVDLHPITVVIVIIVGAQLMGVLGMLISIPVASALKVTLTSVYRHMVEFRA